MSVSHSGLTPLNRCLGMQNAAESNVLLPIGLNNTARFTGTRVTSARKNAAQGGGTWRAEWQRVDNRQEELLWGYWNNKDILFLLCLSFKHSEIKIFK